MNPILQSLPGNFVLLNLGAGGDADYKGPPEVLKTLTVVELDGGSQPIHTSSAYFAKHRVTEFVAGSTGPRTLYKRQFWACSGLAPTIDERLNQFDLQQFYRVLSTEPIRTRAMSEVLDELHLDRIDFLKTDLEGVDFEVIRNLEPRLPRVLAVQAELRFNPLYQGEPPCEEVMAYLRARGFEMAGLRPEYWKPNHPNVSQFADGNIAWADFLFVRGEESTLALARAEGSTLVLHKHVILSALLGKFNQACRLFYRYSTVLPKPELAALTQLLTRFAAANPGLQGPVFAPGFPHLADPVAMMRG